MNHQVKTNWKGGMAFDAQINEHHVIMDAHSEFGGQNLGAPPKHFLLSSLSGCTGMEIVSLLNKMHVPFSSFSIDVEAEITDEHPKVYKKIHLIYHIDMDESEHDKMRKAVTLSQDKYCGVSAMLKMVCPVSWEIQFN
jgi:putative redox protein